MMKVYTKYIYIQAYSLCRIPTVSIAIQNNDTWSTNKLNVLIKSIHKTAGDCCSSTVTETATTAISDKT
jgi:hypothetical protein